MGSFPVVSFFPCVPLNYGLTGGSRSELLEREVKSSLRVTSPATCLYFLDAEDQSFTIKKNEVFCFLPILLNKELS